MDCINPLGENVVSAECGAWSGERGDGTTKKTENMPPPLPGWVDICEARPLCVRYVTMSTI